MDQFAIIVTDENMEMIASNLIDYTVEDIKQEVNALPKGEVVVGIDFLELNGAGTVAYIITRNLFEARNDTNVQLETKELVHVWTY